MLALTWPILVACHTPHQPLNYLRSIHGSATVAGQHNREPNSDPTLWTEQIYETTNHYPGLWGGDFLYEAEEIANRPIMIEEAKKQWNRGAIVHLMWHACSPALAEPCGWDSNGVLSQMSDAQWQDLITDGTAINTTWKQRMDEVAVYLQDLQSRGVVVLFRPIHEMNQKAFWWGGRPGPNGTARLFQITHDYFKNTKGLNNVVWEWDLQDFDSLSSDLDAYNPGSTYFDIFALDIYAGYSQDKYDLALTAAAGKPMAIGECDVLPTPEELDTEPDWIYFMPWAEMVYQYNSVAEIRDVYSASRVITLDKMPGW